MYNKVVIEITPDEYTKTLYKNDGTVAESITMKRKTGQSFDDMGNAAEDEEIPF